MINRNTKFRTKPYNGTRSNTGKNSQELLSQGSSGFCIISRQAFQKYDLGCCSNRNKQDSYHMQRDRRVSLIALREHLCEAIRKQVRKRKRNDKT